MSQSWITCLKPISCCLTFHSANGLSRRYLFSHRPASPGFTGDTSVSIVERERQTNPLQLRWTHSTMDEHSSGPASSTHGTWKSCELVRWLFAKDGNPVVLARWMGRGEMEESSVGVNALCFTLNWSEKIIAGNGVCSGHWPSVFRVELD